MARKLGSVRSATQIRHLQHHLAARPVLRTWANKVCAVCTKYLWRGDTLPRAVGTPHMSVARRRLQAAPASGEAYTCRDGCEWCGTDLGRHERHQQHLQHLLSTAIHACFRIYSVRNIVLYIAVILYATENQAVKKKASGISSRGWCPRTEKYIFQCATTTPTPRDRKDRAIGQS